MNAPLRDSYSHRLFLSLENFAPGQLEKLGTLQHLGIRVKLHVPPEADLLHAERFRRLSELRVRSRRKLLHPSYPLSALPPGGKLQDDVIVRNELGVMGQSASDLVIGLALHHDGIFHSINTYHKDLEEST